MLTLPDAGTITAQSAKRLAREFGFSRARIAAVTPLDRDRERLQSWLRDGRQADMGWFTESYVGDCIEPERHVANARSVLSVALDSWNGPRPKGAGFGKIARFAWGADYHEVMGERLRGLAARLSAEFGGEHRWFVDAGPMLDRAWARRSGVGWIGKNTMVIAPSLGSFVLLGEIITTLEMTPDPPLSSSCGSCRLCQISCPTGALGPDYSLDSRRCISYLTIEHRGPIPSDLRPLMGAWVFGCDICQDVCPPAVAPYLTSPGDRKKWAASTRVERMNGAHSVAFGAPVEPGDNPLFSRPVRPEVDLHWLLSLSHDDYLHAFRGTAVRRAKVWMLRRNAAVALGNVGTVESAPYLVRALEDGHSVVRGHAAWALGRLRRRLGVDVECCLTSALDHESDSYVREEIRTALYAVLM